MEAKDCIKSRRSVRKFKDTPIDIDLVKELVETASYSPSWKHSQIARYYAVTGDLKDKVAVEATHAYPHNGEIIKEAPLLMVVTFVKNRSGFERDGSFSTNKETGWQYFDAGISTQSFTLAAWDKGLGTVIMGIFDDAVVASLLDIPETEEVGCLIPVGFPDETPVAPRRKDVNDLLTIK